MLNLKSLLDRRYIKMCPMTRHGFMPILSFLALAFLYQGFGWSADKPGTSPTAGICDSPYPDPQGNVTFTCHGLTDDQLRLMPSVSTLVGKVLTSGVDSSRLDAQSDYIVNQLREGPASKAKTMKAELPAVSTPTAQTSTKDSKLVNEKEPEIFTYDYRGYKTSSLVGPMLVMGDEGESKTGIKNCSRFRRLGIGRPSSKTPLMTKLRKSRTGSRLMRLRLSPCSTSGRPMKRSPHWNMWTTSQREIQITTRLASS